MPKYRMNPGVFCLEGEWFDNYKKPTSVEPVLELLSTAEFSRIPFIHRDVATVEELEFYLDKWVQRRFDDHPLLYLGFHGSEGRIHVGDQRKHLAHLDFDWFEERLLGRCNRRVIYFASCSTLKVHGARLNRFLARTEALAVCGYEKTVDWVDSAAFDLMLLQRLLGRGRVTRATIRRAKTRLLAAVRPLCRELRFRVVVRN